MRFTPVVLFLLSVFLGCTQSKEEDLFNFPIRDEISPRIENIKPQLISEKEYGFYDFLIIGNRCIGAMPTNTPQGFFYSVESIGGADDDPIFLCRRGRGPDEFLSLIPSIDLTEDGHLHVFDTMKSEIVEIDLEDSITQITTSVVSRQPLEMENISTNSFLSSYYLPDQQILFFDSGADVQSDEVKRTPDYVVYNNQDGKAYHLNCFRDRPLRHSRKAISPKLTLALFDCVNPSRNKLCSVMGRWPQINITDLRSRQTFGVRIKGMSHFARKRIRYHFMDVTATDDRIFALYANGVDASVAERSTLDLFVFDWSGKVLARYATGETFIRCSVSGDNLYLAKLTDNGALQLYCISIKDMPGL